MRKLITGRTKYLILLLLFLAFESLSAQIYPVDITGMAIPPYSVKFYEYGSQGSEKFFINVRLNDIGELGRRVKLKIFLNGRGLNVSSKNYVQGAEAIYLDGGVNLRLTNNDLAPYFKYKNLNGMSSREYAGNLRTGFYKFGFQVFDYITNRPISLKFNIQMYIILNSPPDLIAPKNETLINFSEPPNIFFTWLPRHLNAMAARYEFTLKKIRYKGADPRQVFLSSPVYYQTETFTPSLVYGGGEPFLEEGMMYAWRVKAIVTTGISETSMFKNDGYSEIFWFTFLPQCEPPNMFETNNQNPNETKLTWEHFGGTSYKVEHRAPATDRNIANGSARNMKPSPWKMEKKTKKTEHLFSWNYQPDTDVEYRVGAECFPLSGYVWSDIQTFRTMSPEEEKEIIDDRCQTMAIEPITNFEPLMELNQGDFVRVGMIMVEIASVTKSVNGLHSGDAIAHSIPLLGSVKLKMTYDGIKVNQNYRLIEGFFKAAYDPKGANIKNLDNNVEDLFGDKGEIKEFDAESIEIGSIKIVKPEKEGGKTQIVIVDKNGNIIPINTGVPVVIKGAGGKTFTVNESYEVIEGQQSDTGALSVGNTTGMGNDGEATINNEDIEISLDSSENYYVDKGNGADYEQITTSTGTKPMRYALVSSKNDKITSKGEDDKLSFKISFKNSNYSEKDLIFTSEKGEDYTSKFKNGKLNIRRKFEFAKENIMITYKKKDSTVRKQILLGKFGLWHAIQQEVNVVLVSVNKSTMPKGSDTEDYLNRVYGKAGVKFSVDTDKIKIGKDVWDKNGNGKLDVSDSGMFKKYSSEELAIRNYYKSKEDIDKETYYVFFTSEIPRSNNGILGFMPRKRQFGFVFSGSDANHTLAHELGHGVFGLEHSNSNGLLMNENSKSTDENFTHTDWDTMHAAGFKLYLFDSDDEGELNTIADTDPMEDLWFYFNDKEREIEAYVLESLIKTFTFNFDYFKDSKLTKEKENTKEYKLPEILDEIREKEELSLEKGMYLFGKEIDIESTKISGIILEVVEELEVKLNDANWRVSEYKSHTTNYYESRNEHLFDKVEYVVDEKVYIVFRVTANKGEVFKEHILGEQDFEWIGQFDCTRIEEVMGGFSGCNCVAVGASPSNNCCNQAARAILEAASVQLSGERIIIVDTDEDDNCSTTANQINLTRGLEVLNDELAEGNPVMVGVQKFTRNRLTEEITKTRCSGNNPESTGHYVVIVSRDGNNYRYYEVGTTNEVNGTSTDNIFTLSNNLLETEIINGSKRYRITDIRVNL
ncbi:MAG: hypothetical protein HRT66_08605 [Flavobacteriaceae bacterium]|nr:hypothetical protein [Flavobacteriaceae bacterium]